MENEYITGPQLARRLGLQSQTIRAWRLSGDGPPYVRLSDGPHGRVLYRRADVDKWLAARVFASTSEEKARLDESEARS